VYILVEEATIGVIGASNAAEASRYDSSGAPPLYQTLEVKKSTSPEATTMFKSRLIETPRVSLLKKAKLPLLPMCLIIALFLARYFVG
jgi:hypothetical protein